MFFTRKGDNGSTGWLGEGRLPKYDLRIEALDPSTNALLRWSGSKHNGRFA